MLNKCCPEIDQFDVPLFAEHYIGGLYKKQRYLKIPMDDPIFVQVVQNIHQLGDVQSSRLLVQHLFMDQLFDAPTFTHFKRKVQLATSLEGKVAFDDSWVADQL